MTAQELSRLLILGWGDVGRRTAALALDLGMEVCAAARFSSPDSLHMAAAVKAFRVDLDDPSTLQGLPAGGCGVLYLAPPPDSGDVDERVGHFCDALGSQKLPTRLVYISTSAVYGDCGGALVDETRPPAPGSDRGRRRLDAENRLRLWGRRTGVAVIILRVAGIYGPGRLPLEGLARGMPVLRRDQAPLSNRIHVDDLAQVCLAALLRGRDGDVFNVCDSEPSSMSDYFFAVAQVFGLAPPRELDRAEAEGVFSPLMLSYLAESRRLDNRAMLRRLGIELRFPDLKSGLEAIRRENGQN